MALDRIVSFVLRLAQLAFAAIVAGTHLSLTVFGGDIID